MSDNCCPDPRKLCDFLKVFRGYYFDFSFKFHEFFLIIFRCSWVNLSENVYVKILLLTLIEKFSRTCDFCLITADRPVGVSKWVLGKYMRVFREVNLNIFMFLAEMLWSYRGHWLCQCFFYFDRKFNYISTSLKIIFTFYPLSKLMVQGLDLCYMNKEKSFYCKCYSTNWQLRYFCCGFIIAPMFFKFHLIVIL